MALKIFARICSVVKRVKALFFTITWSRVNFYSCRTVSFDRTLYNNYEQEW